MADDDVDDIPASSTRPFFVSGGFPFVFLPTTFSTGFSGANNNTRVSTNDDQTKTESKTKKVNDENGEEIRIEEAEERAESVENDEVNRNNENDENSDERTDLRISQPKYSQLLKGLDFTQTRMVDVTNLLSDELDQQINDLPENENPKEHSSNEKSSSSSSARSSVSSDEVLKNQKSNMNKNNDEKNDPRTKENLFNAAAADVQKELDNFAAIILGASHLSDDKFEEENTNHLQKRHTFDEDDDTSKQATQNYDLNDNEQEEILQSTKSGKNSRFPNQQNSAYILNENKSSNFYIDTNRNIHSTDQNQASEKQDKQPSVINDWDDLIPDAELPAPPLTELRSSQPIVDSHSTPKKTQERKPVSSSDEEPKIRMTQLPQPKAHRTRLETASSSSSSSSSDTGSVVQYDLRRSKQKQISPKVQHTTPQRLPPQTLRQDSQATLIDENLDDLSSQIKQVLDQERHTVDTSTKEERTTGGIASISMRLSTPDALSTNLLDNDASNRLHDNPLRHPSTQQHHRHSSDIHEHISPPRKRIHQQQQHHHHPHQRHTIPSGYTEHKDASESRRTDNNWLNALERLEHEHRARLEQQQHQYEDHMHTLEDKMKRRFDDYLTLTNGFQESRLDDYDEVVRVYPTPSTVPIDSNIGRHKEHSHGHKHRSSAKDLVSRYYPADSTLNILSSEKKRPTVTTHGVRSRSRDDNLNLRTELSAIHAKHIADLKLYYEYEINELKTQLNRARMGQSSSTNRTSIENIGRITGENVRLQDEVNELRHALKTTEDENLLLKRQVEELREQLDNRELDLKNYHRTIVDLEKQLTETENTKERQDERYRHADRQALLYREENEKIKTDLNLTRDRLLRLEERYNEQENENEMLRRQLFVYENDSNRINIRLNDDHKFGTTMALNQTTSAEYGRFALNARRHTSPKTNASRETNITSRRYKPNDIEGSIRHAHSPRPMTRISDYLNEKPVFPPPYVPPTKRSYSPRKASPGRRRVEPAVNRTSIDRQMRQSDQLEQKFDQLLRKKRDLETRINRIPLRGQTNIDRQLYDVLEREIERVEQQIASTKLELRKLNVLRTH